MHDDILLYSGGLDSYIGYWYLKEELGLDPALLYVNLGHKYAIQERQAIHRTLDYMNPKAFIETTDLNLSNFEREDAFIPNRNAFLAQMGALYGKNIWIVTQKGETNLPDRNKTFYTKMGELLSFLNEGTPVKVDTPFWDLNKKEMVKWYVEKGLDIEELKKTHSCYQPKETHFFGGTVILPCGNCGACFRRWTAMSLNGIAELYAVNPWETDTAQEYLYRGKTGFYGEARDTDILEALERKGIVAYDND